MPLVILKYKEATTVDGNALAATTWNKVPISDIVRDDNSNCVLNLDNTFTISNKIYPKILRFKTKVTVVNNAAAACLCKSRLVSIKGGVITVLDTSLNFKLLTGQNQALIDQLLTTQLNESTTFRLDVWTNQVALFGKAVGDGSEERYASIEILIE